MSQDSSDKTEEPTSRKLSDAREKGQVPKSMELTSTLLLLAACLALFLLSPIFWDNLKNYFIKSISDINQLIDNPSDLFKFLNISIKEFFILVLPFALVIALVGVLANMWQIGGFLFVPDSISPKLDKINFIKGFGKFFKLKAIIDCLKSVFKIAIVFYISYLVIKKNLPFFITLSDTGIGEIALFTLKVSLEIFLKTCLFLLVIAIMDYAYQKWQFLRDMRMSKQEIKDEFKQSEGDPLIKSRIRQAQQEASKKRMLNDVPTADAVIVNPTHLAIALSYDNSKNQAPVVVAKGQGYMALRIKEIAKDAKVPIIENKPLAQALYKVVEVGQMIPVEFYKAVAEILSYIYRVKGRRKKG